MYSTQKGFVPILIILTLTVLTIGGTAFLIFMTYPNILNNPQDSIQKLTNSSKPTQPDSTNPSQKSVFQLLKNQLFSPKSGSSPTNIATPTATPATNPSTSQITSTPLPDKNTPAPDPSPSPIQPTPTPTSVKSYSQMDTSKKVP